MEQGEVVLFTLDDVLVEVIKVDRKDHCHCFLDLRRISDDFVYKNVPDYYVERLKDDP